MAIEPLKKVTVVSPKHAHARLMRWINRLGVMEVIDAREALEEEEHIPFRSIKISTREADEKLRKIDFILSFLDRLSPPEEGFFQGLAPVPLLVGREELDEILGSYNIEERYRLVSELDEVYRRTERVIAEMENELDGMEPLKDLPFDIGDFFAPVRVRMVLGLVPRKNMGLLGTGTGPLLKAAWEEIGVSGPSGEGGIVSPGIGAEMSGDKARMVFAFPAADAGEVQRALSDIGFEEIRVPRLNERVSERIRELEGGLVRYREEREAVAAKARLLATGKRRSEGRGSLIVLKAYWTNVRERQTAASKSVQGRWVNIMSGYVRARDIPKLVAMMDAEFPKAFLKVEDPGPDEDVPVSIRVPYLMRPVQLLLEMFGLPSYRKFDPTPFMQINFYAFFGICFSDVGYGLMLVLASACLSVGTRAYRGVNLFARILLYGGISSIIFGALTGSWFGDLYKPEYLGEGNLLLRFRGLFFVIDPIDRTIPALIAALGIGVLNQYAGIMLRMYDDLRRRDLTAAFSDGVCWIVTLTGLLVMLARVFAEIPGAAFDAGVLLFLAGAAGLVLTQGRMFKSPSARIGAGLMSLYGVTGSYGITPFIGDVLSYSRLLALGLTTSIVAVTFNLIAGMARGVPYVGAVLFIIVMIIGHGLNFFISALGAFVHSMRLLFVEFFGRFYEGGARPFKPLEFDSPLCVMKNSE